MNYDEWEVDEGQFQGQIERAAERERDQHYDDVFALRQALYLQNCLSMIERTMSPGGVD